MRGDDLLVGTIAVSIGLIALGASLFRVPAIAFQLRLATIIQTRYGEVAVRVFYFLLAVAMFFTGASILIHSTSGSHSRRGCESIDPTDLSSGSARLFKKSKREIGDLRW